MPLHKVDALLADAERTPAPGRRVLAIAVAIVAVLTGSGLWLAWNAYDGRVAVVEERVSANAAQAAGDAGRFFQDRVAILESVGATPIVRSADPSRMLDELEAVSNPDLGFAGGVGWIDRAGQLQVEAGTPPDQLPVDLSGRQYVRQAFATGRPVVSDGIVGMLSGDRLVVVAVPTVDRDGQRSGVLTASIQLDQIVASVPALTNASVIDGGSNLVLQRGSVGPGTSVEQSERFVSAEGSISGRGPSGEPDQLMGVAHAAIPRWTVVVGESRTDALYPARHQLVRDLIGIVAIATLVLAAAAFVARRIDVTHREMVRHAYDLTALEALGEMLAAAPGLQDVGSAATAVFGRIFDTDVVFVGLLDDARRRVVAMAETGLDEQAALDHQYLAVDTPSILTDALRGDETLILDIDEYGARYPALVDAVRRQGIGGAMAARFTASNASGAVAVALRGPFPPPRRDVELFEAMVPLMGDAFGRAVAMEAERDASRTFQRALLPRDRLDEDLPLQRALRYRPALAGSEVGGDWYDVFSVGPGRVGFVVGDVVGRGVAAAAVMGQLRSALRALAVSTPMPAAVLSQLDGLVDQIPDAFGATIVFGVLDIAAGSLRIASAGHPPPCIATDGDVTVMEGLRGLPLGIDPSAPRLQEERRLRAEDTLVLYTDGLIERRGEVIDVGIGRLVTALRAEADRPIQTLADNLMAACVTPDQRDDVALVCLRPVGPVARTFSMTIEADPRRLADVRASLRRWLRRKRIADEVIDEVLLATGEAAANGIEHAYRKAHGGELVIEIEDAGTQLVVTVADEGRWVAPEPDSARGRGLRIIGMLSTELSVERSERGTHVRFVVPESRDIHAR